MRDKTTVLSDAVARIGDGATIMVGGFGVPGTPFALLEELRRQGQQHLTLIKNDANEPGMGIDRLLQTGQVDRLVVSHLGLNAHAIELMNSGQLEVSFCPQGILAERIRAAGAGIPAFLSDIGIDTVIAEGRERVRFDGRDYLLEPALHADWALLHADTADTFGNHVYAASARNFNPLMGMAGAAVIVETEQLVSPGDLAPAAVHLPGPFVDYVVKLETLLSDYGVIER